MSAIELARLRALGARSTPSTSSLEQLAAAIGRIPQRADDQMILARHPEAPTPADLEVVTARLPDSALVALGLSIGLAWGNRVLHPHPGQPFTVADVSEAARRMGISVAASRHIVGAVRHVLTHAGLLDVDDRDVARLGPLIAAWSEADLEAFRRNLDALPEPIRPPS